MCRILRALGVTRVSMLIDDLLIAAETEEECQRCLEIAIQLFTALGFETNMDKCHAPVRALDYVGIVIADSGELRIEQSRLERYGAHLQSALFSGQLKREDLATLLGKLSWAALILRGARAHMRRMWDLLAAHPEGFEGNIPLTAGFCADAGWWITHIRGRQLAGSLIWLYGTRHDVVTIKTDGSGSSRWCFVSPTADGTHHLVHGRNRGRDAEIHVPFIELSAVHECCCAHAREWSGRLVRFGIDAASMADVLNTHTSSDPDLMRLIRFIAALQTDFRFDIVGVHVTRSANRLADEGTHVGNHPQDYLPYLDEEGFSATEFEGISRPYPIDSPLLSTAVYELRLGRRRPLPWTTRR